MALLLTGIVALNRVRMEIPLEKENQDKLVKFVIRIGVFSVLYLVPLLTVISCYLYEHSYRSVWETTWVQERCRDYHIPCPFQVGVQFLQKVFIPLDIFHILSCYSLNSKWIIIIFFSHQYAIPHNDKVKTCF